MEVSEDVGDTVSETPWCPEENQCIDGHRSAPGMGNKQCCVYQSPKNGPRGKDEIYQPTQNNETAVMHHQSSSVSLQVVPHISEREPEGTYWLLLLLLSLMLFLLFYFRIVT